MKLNRNIKKFYLKKYPSLHAPKFTNFIQILPNPNPKNLVKLINRTKEEHIFISYKS